ncbi:MAG TPA: AAA-like domain-containing protein [Chthonomonadaceae bacterium]|nr:AAA-like domain-containing protein [Chthonomonadaceae bacterium]
MLHISLFGPFDARLNESPLLKLHLYGGTSLLAFLALHHDRSLNVDWVADILWPRGENPAASLRKSVEILRRELGEEASCLETGHKTLLLHLKDASTDLIAFDALIEKGDVDSLKKAILLYKGPLLLGWEYGWVLADRDKREERYLQALQTLADRAAAAQDHLTTARYLRRAVIARPTQESNWCGLMQALVKSAERLEAMEIYRRYRDYLYRRGKLEPPAAMKELYAYLQREPQPVATERRSDFLVYEPVGGAVPLNSRFYIARAADAVFQAARARRDSTILIKGSRQTGKSSLLARGLDLARREGARVAFTDFRRFSAAEMETLDSFYLALARSLADQLDLDVAPDAVWNPQRAATDSFERYVKREVLVKSAAPLVWGLEEVDRLFPCAYKDDVFGLFRAWHNARSFEPDGPWERLTLILAYATEAYKLVSNLNQSPFNVGTQIALNDFSPEQVADLNARYERPLRDEAELARFIALVSGHPFLVRQGLHEMKTRQLDIAALEAQADQVGGIYGNHLDRLLVSLSQDAQHVSVVREVLRQEHCSDADSFYRLRSAGILAGASEQEARLRCQVYQTFLARRLL